MQFTVIMLVLVCATAEVLSWFRCKPCNCSEGYDEKWIDLKVATCDYGTNIRSIPSTDTLPDETQVLHIRGGSIPTIQENKFVTFKNLQIIKIFDSQVSKIEKHAFRNMTNVTIITLSFNLLTELPAGLFLDTPSLVEIWLRGNKLMVIPKNIFSNLKFLETVWLSENEIISIEANCFMNVPLLETLTLYNNNLTSLSMNIIDNSRSLKMLHLEFNPWNCDEYLCDVMASVLSRRMWHTGFIPTCATPKNLRGKRWNKLKNHALLRQCRPPSPCRLERPSVAYCSTPLSSANLRNTLPNNITHLHITDQLFTTLDNNTFSTYGLLQELHLEKNHVRNIESNAFLNLKILSVLNLADNNLENLQKNIFNPIPNLTKILLNKNNLTRLYKFQFSNLIMLKEVDFSVNNISFIEDECFVNLSSLRIINLSNNQLQTLQLNVLPSVMSLERLYLQANPWRCDEALCGVLDAVVGRKLWGPDHIVPVCAAPPLLAGKPWSQLPQNFHPNIFILDTNHNWVRAGRATSVLAAHDFTMQCRHCFVSRITWTLNSIKLPHHYQRTSQKALVSTLTMENIHRLDEGTYVCQVSQCPECDTAWLHVAVNMYIPNTPIVQQGCGELVPEGVTNVVNSTSVKKGEFPWHIGLYRFVGDKHVYKCGGSIINPLIIITAAHCFTNEKGLRYPDEEFYIGAGKYYRNYNSAEDIFAQKRQVKEYHIPSEYRGYESNYAGDLAVVVVKQAFRITNVVHPVCIDLDGTMETQQLQHNNTGSVVGWGYVNPNTRQESEELKRLNPPFITRTQCLNEVPSNFRRWITLDKFCAGFRTGASLCDGDSGGGLVFKRNNTQKYFIGGLASVGPTRQGVCDDSQYGVYTKISFYNLFIRNIININPVND